jgi:Zn-dependent membrane protease YugP
MFYFDSNYMLFVLIPGMILGGLAQMYLKGTYSTWSKRRNGANVTGVKTAQSLMAAFGLSASLERTPNQLGDHFDPRSQVVRLSPTIADQPSVAAMAVAAHEFGHVQQYHQNSPLIAARGFIMPVAQFGSYGAYLFLFGGLIFNFFELALLGLILFGVVVLFSVLTLPIEFDASRRAMKMLEGAGLIVTREDRQGAQAVLRAAALTYVAATAVAILNFAYYAMLVLGRRD